MKPIEVGTKFFLECEIIDPRKDIEANLLGSLYGNYFKMASPTMHFSLPSKEEPEEKTEAQKVVCSLSDCNHRSCVEYRYELRMKREKPEEKRDRWEYLFADSNELKHYGAEGWEAIQYIEYSSSYFLKRKITN